METALPEFVHGEHFMRGVPMVVKCLGKDGNEPVRNKKEQDWHE